MDILNLSEKVRGLSTKTKDVYQWLADVLDGAEVSQKGESSKGLTFFESRQNVESLLDQKSLYHGSTEERTQELFAGLSPFFEAGLLLKSFGAKWQIQELFLFGQAFKSPSGNAEVLDLAIPEIQPSQVLKCKGRMILEVLNLRNLVNLSESSAFLFRPGGQTYFIAFTNLIGPWQQVLVEETFFVIHGWRLRNGIKECETENNQESEART